MRDPESYEVELIVSTSSGEVRVYMKSGDQLVANTREVDALPSHVVVSLNTSGPRPIITLESLDWMLRRSSPCPPTASPATDGLREARQHDFYGPPTGPPTTGT